ncbi:MAG: SIMPL domain-containing protein [Clostridia bacterium]|nr:SIMPL domain-containing protein [Clostridia bacterium]
MKKLMILMAALCMALLPAMAAADGTRTVTVHGTATVLVEADSAVVSFGIETRAKDASSASEDNAARTQELRQALLEAGILEKDITTEYYFVNPMYDYSSPAEDGIQKVTGYLVSNTLSVRVRETDRIGGLIDIALGAGATSCNGISFSSSLSADAQDDALAAAVAEASRKAKIVAEACGGNLGSIVSITEQDSFNNGAVFNKRTDAGAVEAAEEDAVTEIVSGGLRYSSTVVVVYELKDAE